MKKQGLMEDRDVHFPYFSENKAHLYAHFVCISAAGLCPAPRQRRCHCTPAVPSRRQGKGAATAH